MHIMFRLGGNNDILFDKSRNYPRNLSVKLQPLLKVVSEQDHLRLEPEYL